MNEKKSSIKKDAYLIAVILLIGMIAFIILLATFKNGERVMVKYDGEIVAEYRLSENATYKIDGSLGGLLLIIQDNEAYVTAATCPDKICEHMGKISGSGQSIICIPNRLVIYIDGGAAKIDGISG